MQNCHNFQERSQHIMLTGRGSRVTIRFFKCHLWCTAIVRMGRKVNIFEYYFCRMSQKRNTLCTLLIKLTIRRPLTNIHGHTVHGQQFLTRKDTHAERRCNDSKTNTRDGTIYRKNTINAVQLLVFSQCVVAAFVNTGMLSSFCLRMLHQPRQPVHLNW